MNFRQQFILAFIIVQALLIFTIVFLNLAAVKNNSYKLISDQVDSSTVLLSEVVKTPLLMSDLATLDDALKSFVAVKNIVTVSVYDSRNRKISYANSSNEDYVRLIDENRDQFDDEKFYLNLQRLSFLIDDKNLIPVQYRLDVAGETLGYLRFIYDSTEVEVRISDNEQLTYLLAFISIILGLLAAITLADRLTGALHKLIHSANKIAKGKQVNLEGEHWSFEEVAELSKAMDSMQQQIKLRNDSLIEAERKAIMASEAKSEFLAVMSHEIRTPLNGMLGSLSLVEPDHLSEEDQQYFYTVRSSSELLLAIINDILDYSKIEAGKLTIEKQELSISQILSDTKAVYETIANEHSIELKVSDTGLIHEYYQGDDVRIKQVINNLVSNAIKFTEEGSVTVHVFNDNEKVVLEVEDTGIGISEEQQSELFKDFSQVHKGASRNYGGTGLGLAISMRLVNLMGGQITVQSEYGKGSVFRVELPLQVIEKHDSLDRDSTPKKLTNKALEIIEDSEVLLVEDNKVNQMIAIKLLEKADCNVTLAENGMEALEKAFDNGFDVILMDCQMPVMDGYEASMKIRKAGLKTPIIALTANAQDADRKRCMASGMDDFLSKPFKAEELYLTISENIKRKR